MTTTTKRLPLLTVGIATGALILGVAGVATAHAPADDIHGHGGMQGGQVGHGMHGSGHMGSGHMGGGMSGMMHEMVSMMSGHMMSVMGGGMMDGIDQEAMADIRAQMAELHDQMVALHVQALQDAGTSEDEEVTPTEDAEGSAPEDV